MIYSEHKMYLMCVKKLHQTAFKSTQVGNTVFDPSAAWLLLLICRNRPVLATVEWLLKQMTCFRVHELHPWTKTRSGIDGTYHEWQEPRALIPSIGPVRRSWEWAFCTMISAFRLGCIESLSNQFFTFPKVAPTKWYIYVYSMYL